MPSFRRLLLRPAVLASVLAHGGLVAAGLWGASAADATRPATVTGFVSEDWAGAIDADVPPPEPEMPREVEAVAVEPRPAETPVADDVPIELPPLEQAPAAATLGVGGVPVGLRTRAVPDPTPVAAVVAAAVARPEVTQRVGGGPTRDAVRLGNRKPPYPPQALAQGWQGVARLVVEVRADGTVGAVRLAESSGHSVLDEAAVAAAWSWTYAPRLVDGVPAPDLLQVPVDFRIR
jgi:protein TonB